MIASLKNYSRIARLLLGVLGALLIVGIIGSLLMGVRAKRTAEEMVVSQARSIADSSLSLVFEPSDLTAPVGSTRAAELTEQIQGVVVDPSDFDQVTVYSPEGTILYSTEEGRIGNELPGEKDHIKEALKDDPQVTTFQGEVSIMLPLRFRSGVGSPAVVELTRPDTPIATAPGPWNTNAVFLFAMLVVLGLAVFGVARLLSVVANTPERAAELPRPAQPQERPVRAASPQPGLREEGEARRKAEARATAAEERLGLLQDQYRKALEELQDFRELAREPRITADPELEERALHAEGQLRTLEAQLDTLQTERARLGEQLQDALRAPVTVDDGRVATLEDEAESLRRELDRTRAQLTDALLRDDRVAGAGDEELRAELDTNHIELLRAKDDLSAAEHDGGSCPPRTGRRSHRAAGTPQRGTARRDARGRAPIDEGRTGEPPCVVPGRARRARVRLRGEGARHARIVPAPDRRDADLIRGPAASGRGRARGSHRRGGGDRPAGGRGARDGARRPRRGTRRGRGRTQ